MAILQTDEANILDAEATNWRLFVYPVLAVLVLFVGGFGFYFYLQNQRDQLEATARAEAVLAKTPEDLVKVADKYPGADQSTLALIGAANLSFAKHDYDGAAKNYQRITQNTAVTGDLRDTAQIGLASSLEAAGKSDDAVNAYLVVAHTDSPFVKQAQFKLKELNAANQPSLTFPVPASTPAATPAPAQK
jgi:predicted negative regulator of RcsB-dependent stress response